MAKSLILNMTDLVTFTIKIEGEEIPGTYQINSILVVREINRIPYARILLSDGGVGETNTFAAGNANHFIPGNKISILAGYHSNEDSIFEGIVVKHRIKVKGGQAQLVIECRHSAIKLTLSRNNAIFIKKTDSQIITEILSAYSKEVTHTSLTHEQLIQHYTSDWDFVLMRADVNGLVVIPDLEKLLIKEPNFNSAPKFDVHFGSTMIAFDTGIDARTQLPKVTCYGWDVAKQSLIKAQGNPRPDTLGGNLKPDKLDKSLGLTDYVMQTATHVSSEMLDTWATAKLTRAKLAQMQGKVMFRGEADVLPGDLLQISGLSDRFNGKVFVGGITHTIEGGNWTTEASIGLSENWYVEETPGIESSPSSGLIPSIGGLSVAKVSQIPEDDPNGNYRIKISIPTLQQDNVTVWARLASFYATTNAGAFFMPEVDDEVVVGFINEDPQNPVILGMLPSKAKKPGLSPKSDNPEKAIITRGQLKIHLHDKDKVITISTPGNNQICISDKDEKIEISDQHQNQIIMSGAGIQIKSPKDLVLEAEGNIIMKATNNLEAKASSDVKVEGINVTLKGQAQFAAEGAMAELKGSGQTTVKGAIVMIN